MRIAKKSYWQLAVFTLLFVLVPIASMGMLGDLLPEIYATKITLAYFFLAIFLLMLYMTCTGRAYWISGGPSYEETVAEPYRARAFLVRHLISFGIATLAFLLYVGVAAILKAAWYFDVSAFCILLIGAAISTVKVHF